MSRRDDLSAERRVVVASIEELRELRSYESENGRPTASYTEELNRRIDRLNRVDAEMRRLG